MTRYRCMAERLHANSRAQHTGHAIDGVPSECWLWQGNVDAAGYGRLTRRIDGQHRKERAHRVSYETFVRALRADETLDHLCRITGCIHPNHVEPVSRPENTRRRWAAYAERSPA